MSGSKRFSAEQTASKEMHAKLDGVSSFCPQPQSTPKSFQVGWAKQRHPRKDGEVGGGMTSVLGKLSAKSNEETRERLWQALGEPQGSGPKGKMPASIWCSELTKCVSQ